MLFQPQSLSSVGSEHCPYKAGVVGSNPTGTTKISIMEKNEIKKALYKQNPVASFKMVRKGIAYYTASIEDDSRKIPETRNISFEVPIEDMGDADFLNLMEGKLLIRWIA